MNSNRYHNHMRLRLLLYFDDLIVLKFALYAHFTPVPIFFEHFSS